MNIIIALLCFVEGALLGVMMIDKKLPLGKFLLIAVLNAILVSQLLKYTKGLLT